LPTQVGLIEAIHVFLTAIVITAPCIELIIMFAEIYTQVPEKN
jgi:hypothetical protein